MPSAKNNKPKRYLEDNYEPHENDVLIGRGRRVETHNVKFRAMISAHLAAYYNAQTKATKSTIILRIFQQVKKGGGTGFVKQEASSRRWFAIEDSAARISIAQAFRDALSSEYKSSKQYKQAKRQEERGEVPMALGQMMMSGMIRNAQQVATAPTSLDELFSMPSPPTLDRKISKEMPPLSSFLAPPPLVPVVSSDSLSQAKAQAKTSLQAMMKTVDTESFLRASPELSSSSGDILAGLERAIGANMDLSDENPFEPIPLKETNLLWGDGDADLMDATRFALQQQQYNKPEEEDLFHVFDSLPTLDMRHALSA